MRLAAVSLLILTLIASASLAGVAPGSLLIYYGWPSGINGAFAVTAAAAEFAAYDDVVLGDGLELATHPDHANTVAIIAQVHATATTRVFGYIDLGVSTQNFTLAEIGLRVDAWQATGADGVFFDDFGYDFQVTRARQNAAVALAHARGLPVVANGWNPDDVFGAAIDPVANPDGAPTALGAGDFYLSESFQVAIGEYQDEAAWFAKAEAVAAYRAQLGFDVLAVTTNDAANAYDAAKFAYAWYSALLCGYASVGWGEHLFAATTGVAPYRERPAAAPGSGFLSGIFAESPVYRRATDQGWVIIDAASHSGDFTPGAAAADEAPGWDVQLGAAPNPFNPRTSISFRLPGPSIVRFEVFTLAGRRVATLVEGVPYAAGAHTLSLDGEGLPSGVYLGRLATDAGMATCRLTLVR